MAGELDESYVGMTLCDTRMNLAHDYILGALKQSGFIAGLSRNELWRSFIDSRTAKDKLSWEIRLAELNDNKRYDMTHFILCSTLHLTSALSLFKLAPV